MRLARHPDYHAGKITFSYLGDIWTANEDGSDLHRLTDNIAREVYPRFSPDGKWIAFSSNRYGNYDVFVIPAGGGAPKRLTYHTGNDEVVGWSRDSQQRHLPRGARRRRVPQRRRPLRGPGRPAGMEKPLPVDWGYWGSFSPDGKSLVFNRHPAVWSRQHYRGSYAADLWVANLADKTYTKLLGDEQLQPLLADVGRRRRDLLRRRSAAQRQERQAGQPRGAQERQQHLQDSRVRRRPAGPGDAGTPTATCSGRRCRATAR